MAIDYDKLTKAEFSQLAGVPEEMDHVLVKWVHDNLKIPFKPDENYDRMICGLPYNAYQPELEHQRMIVRDKLRDYGDFRCRNYANHQEYIKAKATWLKEELLGKVGDNVFIEYPIYFDYGFNTLVGDNFYANYGLTILDVGLVKIGDNVMCGTNVLILTATHPLDPTLRASLMESGNPIIIGNNVWLGANSTVLPGVTIGDGCVIGAGAVVTKNVPENSVVVGVPGRVVKTLDPTDKLVDVQALLKKHGFDYQ